MPIEFTLREIPTSSEASSIKLSLSFPEHVAVLAEVEAALLHVTVSGLLRRVLRWNAGTSPGRPAQSPQRDLPTDIVVGKKGRKLQMRLEHEDFLYLKKLGSTAGLNNSGVLSMLLLKWLEIDPLERAPESF